MRVGLFTPSDIKFKKSLISTVATHVDVTTPAAVTKALEGLGAKRVGLFWRDNASAGHMEGDLGPIANLKQEHLDWVGGKGDQYQLRGLFYVKD